MLRHTCLKIIRNIPNIAILLHGTFICEYSYGHAKRFTSYRQHSLRVTEYLFPNSCSNLHGFSNSTSDVSSLSKRQDFFWQKGRDFRFEVLLTPCPKYSLHQIYQATCLGSEFSLLEATPQKPIFLITEFQYGSTELSRHVWQCFDRYHKVTEWWEGSGEGALRWCPRAPTVARKWAGCWMENTTLDFRAVDKGQCSGVSRILWTSLSRKKRRIIIQHPLSHHCC